MHEYMWKDKRFRDSRLKLSNYLRTARRLVWNMMEFKLPVPLWLLAGADGNERSGNHPLDWTLHPERLEAQARLAELPSLLDQYERFIPTLGE